ncbi:hypothetical protein RJ640_002723 [Escallonia rubra]|uniref:(+)-neomenthol dehydrogenase-like n=1 Tax=Escallonia rubra TaxID=112253 RepID=A0AA88RS33_9ASTE|nr:hypothetical protein RJ640_002723 [Escallonia rubra]
MEITSGKSPPPPTISVRERVVFPDLALIFPKYPLSTPLFTKEYINCVYSFPNSSHAKQKLPQFPLTNISNEWAKGVLSDAERLTEERVDEVLNEFLKDFKEGALQAKCWPAFFAAYTVSKTSMNAYTRILARKYTSFCINYVCPGYVKTDINNHTSMFTVEEGVACPVKLALLPDSGPSGLFFFRVEASSFE